MVEKELTVKKTRTFVRWLCKLKDREARAAVQARIRRWQVGLLGDVRDLGEGMFEMRIDFGPGYRVYGVRIEQVTILLLCGGDKGGQARDIARARRMALRVKAGDCDEKSF